MSAYGPGSLASVLLVDDHAAMGATAEDGRPYVISTGLGNLDAANYSFTLVDGQLTVTKAVLTVTADGKTRQYSDPDPVFTYSISEFKNGQTLGDSGVTGTATCSTAATSSTAPAASAITCLVGTLAAANYSFSFTPGTLTITKEDMRVSETGQSFFNTGSVGGRALRNVSATISEDDSHLGPLSWSSIGLKVRFTAYTGAAVSGSDPWCEAVVPDGSSTGSATAGCDIAGLRTTCTSSTSGCCRTRTTWNRSRPGRLRCPTLAPASPLVADGSLRRPPRGCW